MKVNTKILKAKQTSFSILSSDNDHCYIYIYIQGGPKKTAQSLWHHNFATVHHSHVVFSKMFRKKFFTRLRLVFEYSS